ncbi:MAG: hypothetical protein WBI12_07015 [Methanosarcina flavescens]|jgi:hypothetical protein
MITYNYVNDVILKVERIMGEREARGEVDTLPKDTKDWRQDFNTGFRMHAVFC